MRIALALTLLLAACGKAQPPPAASKIEAPASAPIQSSEAPVLNPDYVVDEPLPPFDEGGGRPRLVAQSAVSSGGQMFLFEANDGTRLLRFEDLHVDSAPELEVVLSKTATPSSSDFSDTVPIGPLKGVRGNQNYLVSSKIVLAPLKTVAVISRVQSLVLATAPLTPP